MNIDDRIKKIGDMFLGFNIDVSQNAAYAVIRFPSKEWNLPDKNTLKNTYNIEVAVQDGNVFFVTEIENGVECLFDAIDYTIEFNNEAIERMNIFYEKLDEFKKLFATEKIENLKKLEFTISGKKKFSKQSKKVQEESVETTTEQNSVCNEQNNEEKKSIADDSSLLSLAEELTK